MLLAQADSAFSCLIGSLVAARGQWSTDTEIGVQLMQAMAQALPQGQPGQPGVNPELPQQAQQALIDLAASISRVAGGSLAVSSIRFENYSKSRSLKHFLTLILSLAIHSPPRPRARGEKI